MEAGIGPFSGTGSEGKFLEARGYLGPLAGDVSHLSNAPMTGTLTLVSPGESDASEAETEQSDCARLGDATNRKAMLK